MNYNLDNLDRIKKYLRKTSTSKDAELILSLDEAYRDFNNWLKSKGVDSGHLPFDVSDPDIDFIKDIEARGGAGYYTEEAWMQTFQDEDREMEESKPTNTHLALYYQKRNAFFSARFGIAKDDTLSFKKGSTADECPPDQEACTNFP